MTLLSQRDLESRLETLPGWTYDPARGGIARSFKFQDFGDAFSFMTRVALEAERADHHPDWTNVWNRVDILLSTHSEGGVTEKDISLASRINSMWG